MERNGTETEEHREEAEHVHGMRECLSDDSPRALELERLKEMGSR